MSLLGNLREAVVNAELIHGRVRQLPIIFFRRVQIPQLHLRDGAVQLDGRHIGQRQRAVQNGNRRRRAPGLDEERGLII